MKLVEFELSGIEVMALCSYHARTNSSGAADTRTGVIIMNPNPKL